MDFDLNACHCGVGCNVIWFWLSHWLGLILETSISSGEDSRLFTINVEQYVKQVIVFSRDGLNFKENTSNLPDICALQCMHTNIPKLTYSMHVLICEFACVHVHNIIFKLAEEKCGLLNMKPFGICLMIQLVNRVTCRKGQCWNSRFLALWCSSCTVRHVKLSFGEHSTTSR